MAVPDYSNSPSSAPLPPLPQSATSASGEQGDTSTAGYTGYGNYPYSNPYDGANWANTTSGYVPPGINDQQDLSQSGEPDQPAQEE